jgi:hypothetical protein
LENSVQILFVIVVARIRAKNTKQEALEKINPQRFVNWHGRGQNWELGKIKIWSASTAIVNFPHIANYGRDPQTSDYVWKDP